MSQWKWDLFSLLVSVGALYAAEKYGADMFGISKKLQQPAEGSSAVQPAPKKKTSPLFYVFLSVLCSIVGLVSFFEAKRKRKEYNLLLQSPHIQISHVLEFSQQVSRAILSGRAQPSNQQLPLHSPISNQPCIGYLVLIRETIQEEVAISRTVTNAEGKEEISLEFETAERTRIVYKDLNLRKFELVDDTGNATIKLRPTDRVPMESSFQSQLQPHAAVHIFNQLGFAYIPDSKAVSYSITEKILPVNGQLTVCGDVKKKPSTSKVLVVPSDGQASLIFLDQAPAAELRSRKLKLWIWLLVFCGSSSSSLGLLIWTIYSRIKNK